MLDYNRSFIETQFPVSKISKESYKERKANLGQTLTGLGKWWGRKPLILVRATVLGVLLPVSDDPKKDREIFLKLLTMDDEGLLLRKAKNLTTKQLFALLTKREKENYFTPESTEEKPKYKRGITRAEKLHLQKLTFNRLSYDDKLKYCDRPEHVENLSESAWDDINDHLETSATNLQQLVKQLGEKRYGHTPRVGDCFAGGGSIPFESARVGSNIFASDLNPVATLLTWSSINIAGATTQNVERLKEFQKSVYEAVDKDIVKWGIEHNDDGHRADAYLYCNESACPECGYKVPLSPSWYIGKGTKTVAILNDNGLNGFNIDIIQNATEKDINKAESMITIKDGKLNCPHCKKETPIPVLRRDWKDNEGKTVYGLRRWEKNEFIPRTTDVFQERLFCIRYVKEYIDEKGNEKIDRYYISPTKKDLEREEMVESILSDNFLEWQDKGYLPSDYIEEGFNTDQPIRERGWQYWHQMFNPRQLLVNGLFVKNVNKFSTNNIERAFGLLGINKLCNWNAKLSRWNSDGANEKGQEVFSNQALNTLYNYLSRTMLSLQTTWFFNVNNSEIHNDDIIINVSDARSISTECDIWITDPPYADAVNYHELSEFFLSWNKTILKQTFPDWYSDSKKVLAVKGTGESFNKSMVEIYRNLANNMPDNGTQVVMFTHQDVRVWAELAMILWSSGLKVVSAWNIATETDASGLKQGNYVKGTVLLTLKRQTSEDIAFQDEVYRKIRKEVQFQIDSMKNLDDKEDPNFTDADYSLAAYASSLKVLTEYKGIEGIDIPYELSKPRDSHEEGPIETLINKARKIANNFLIPEGFDKHIWRDLIDEERFFIRGLELEMNNIYKVSAYQELARSFGVGDYKGMFENFRANSVRLKTATEYGLRGIDRDEFGSSLIRQTLVSLNQCVKAESTVEGVNYLRAKFNQNNEYWNKRITIMEVLGYISRFENISHMNHWYKDAYYARLLREALKNG